MRRAVPRSSGTGEVALASSSRRGDVFPSDARMKAAGFGSYDAIVRVTAQKAAEDGTIPSCIDGDFPACGKAYRDLTDDEWCRHAR